LGEELINTTHEKLTEEGPKKEEEQGKQLRKSKATMTGGECDMDEVHHASDD